MGDLREGDEKSVLIMLVFGADDIYSPISCENLNNLEFTHTYGPFCDGAMEYAPEGTAQCGMTESSGTE